jgi:two-component system chemotaxis response regulator CheB
MDTKLRHVVVIGASSGGVTALLQIAEALPAQFASPVCVVQHVGSRASLLPELLQYRGPNRAVHALDGQRLEAGTIFVAPPDYHLLVEGEVLRLRHGPKENHARPAIDPLFRSAALSLGPRVIGVILTGQMDDGSAGLKAVKDCGGIAVVQDPETAEEPEMPRSALASVAADHCVPLAEVAPLLQRLAGRPPAAARAPVPKRVAREVAINLGDAKMENLIDIGSPSPLTCPDCGGGLWEMADRPLRYRCHTGHAYSSLALAQSQQEVTEQALWSGMRALREREMLLRRMALVAEAAGDTAQVAAGLAEADRLHRHSEALKHIAERAAASATAEPVA